jgi:hypothetical protein
VCCGAASNSAEVISRRAAVLLRIVVREAEAQESERACVCEADGAGLHSVLQIFVELAAVPTVDHRSPSHLKPAGTSGRLLECYTL